jgi:1,4-dihydroxy-2-naphthoate octaprenyltransferase
MLWVLVIVHLFLYPASNGFNSYFDKDEKSIGGIKNPPPVNISLYYLALLFDGLAIVLGVLIINLTFGIMLFVYGLASKAYSHPSVRLKKYPWGGWLITGFFQGFFMILTFYIGINNFDLETTLFAKVLIAGVLASLMLWGNYPMTQIYQHEEDSKRGDITLSLTLGVPGTFHFTMAAFGIATLGFLRFFIQYYGGNYSVQFLTFLSPVVLYFLYWYFRVRKDWSRANYTHTMRLNFISALCLNAFFIYFFLDASNVLNTF